MEKHLFDCLLVNLLDFNKQFLPKGLAVTGEESHKTFFDILVEKMGGDIEGIPVTIPFPLETMAPAFLDVRDACGETTADQGQCGGSIVPVGPGTSPDRPALILETIEFGLKSAALGLVELISPVIDVLFDGDEIELQEKENLAAIKDLSVSGAGRAIFSGPIDGGTVAGQLLSLIYYLNNEASRSVTGKTAQTEKNDLPGVQQRNYGSSVPQAEAVKIFTQPVVLEGGRAPAVLAEVVKAEKKGQPYEILHKQDGHAPAERGLTVTWEAKVPKEDPLTAWARDRFLVDDKKEPVRIIVRVVETRDGEPHDGRDGRAVHHNEHPRHDFQKSPTQGAGINRSDFGSLMANRIEKIVEQFTGKSTNMDMLVRLKIDEKDTLLVGFKDEGGRVTVQLRTTNEGVLSILQSQRDEMAKNLAEKNVYASIHIDLKQENRGKQNGSGGRNDSENDEQGRQEFSTFIEKLV